MPQCLVGWVQETQSSFCSTAMRWGAGAGLPASWVSVGTAEHSDQSLDISTMPRDEPPFTTGGQCEEQSFNCLLEKPAVRSKWKRVPVIYAAVFILWVLQNLTNSQVSGRGDKTGCQELSFTYCTRVCTTTTGKSLGVCKLRSRKLLLWGMLN